MPRKTVKEITCQAVELQGTLKKQLKTKAHENSIPHIKTLEELSIGLEKDRKRFSRPPRTEQADEVASNGCCCYSFNLFGRKKAGELDHYVRLDGEMKRVR